MTNLEQLKHEGILDMISQLSTLTDDELEELIQSTTVGVAQDMINELVSAISDIGLCLLFIGLLVIVINYVRGNI